MDSHAEKRQSFNERFKDVLVAKNEYQGHVKAANQATASFKRYARLALRQGDSARNLAEHVLDREPGDLEKAKAINHIPPLLMTSPMGGRRTVRCALRGLSRRENPSTFRMFCASSPFASVVPLNILAVPG